MRSVKHRSPLYSAEPQRATTFIRRSSWAVLFGLGAMAGAMWLARFAQANDHRMLLDVVRPLFQAAFVVTIGLLVVLQRRLAAHTSELRVMARRLKAAQSAAHLGYWEVDCGTGERFWSREMYHLWGIPEGTAAPDTDAIVAAAHPDDRERFRNAIARRRDGSQDGPEQVRVVLPDGTERVLETQSRRSTTDDGRTMLIGTAQDVTERVKLETRLRQSQKMEAVGQLAGGVAHDFNNILTVIEGYSRLLASGGTLHPRDRDAVTEILEASQRASALTRQLLVFSRRQVLQPRVLDLNEAITGVHKMLRRLIGENIEILTNLSEPLAPVKADPGQIEQVLLNLALNARDAMPAGGVLVIETANAPARENEPPRVMFSVRDTGSGIDPAVIDRIFEPFFTTKESGKGTGLGLATVQSIVEQLGGRCEVQTAPGRGAMFRIYLPAHAGDSESITPARRAPSAPVECTGTVLVAEDDESLRTMACTVLRRTGYTVYEASNGIEALRRCGDTDATIDLVLADMVMPGLGGLELARDVQRLRPGVPVIIMSGYANDAATLSTTSEPGLSFLEKPFTPETLQRAVSDAIASGVAEVIV